MAEATPPTADPSARSQLGRTPIPGPSPAGEAPNELPEFEQLREEATKDPVQGPPSWEMVARLGEALLRERSKDFVVASYTGVALAQTDGLAGLHDGIHILDGMLRTHWDAGSPPIPKRMRARANAVAWFAEKIGALLERMEFKQSEKELLEATLEAAGSLGDAVAEKFPAEHEVGVGPILSALRDATRRVAADAPSSPAPAQAAPGPAAAPAARPASPAPAAAGPGEIANRNDALRAVRQAARFLRDEKASNPEVFALPRVMAWGPLPGAPPANDGKTMIPPPPRAAVEQAQQGGPEALLRAVEDAFASAPLWLDLQRHAVQALEQLGPAYRPARGLVVALLRDLLDRAPTLPSLQFNDGSDLADGLTRQWLAEEILAGDGGGAAVAPAAPARGVDPAALSSLRREVAPLVKKGQIAEVQGRLRELFAEDPSPRARFQERFELAALCLDGGRERVALGILDGLEGELRSHALDGWDPGLTAQVLQSLYRAHVKVLGKNPTPEQAARREEVFGRLCRLDPALAVVVD